jgi:hypothetical protein
MTQNAPVLASYNPAGIPRTKAAPATTDYGVGQDGTGVYRYQFGNQPSANSGVSTATGVSGAAASSTPNTAFTSEALTTATTYTLTLTNALIKTTSVIQCTAWCSTTALANITSIACSNGSVVIHFAFASLTGTLKANVSIFN